MKTFGKTAAGGLLLLGSAAAIYFGYNDLAGIMLPLGAGLGMIGLAHRIAKVLQIVIPLLNALKEAADKADGTVGGA